MHFSGLQPLGGEDWPDLKLQGGPGALKLAEGAVSPWSRNETGQVGPGLTSQPREVTPLWIPELFSFVGTAPQAYTMESSPVRAAKGFSSGAFATSSRAEGLLFVHGLESNPGSSLQTEEEAGLP